MTAEVKTTQNITKTFKYAYPTCTNEEVLFKLEVPVEIPHDGSTRELVQRVINMFHIPVYLEDELNDGLAKFVAEETKAFHNERDERLINQLKNGELNSEGIVKNWEKLFKDNVMDFAEQKGISDEEVFAAAYHKLVHSPALEMILQVENSYAKTYGEVLSNRDNDIEQLTQKQTDEMEEKVRQLNITTTEEEINDLAAQHFEEQSLVAGRWGSQLDALWQTQKTQYRAWLMSTLDEYQSTAALNTPSNSPLATFSTPPAPTPPPAPQPRLEESFTIHLGSQLKQTHNIRIVVADLLEPGASDDRDSAERRAGAPPARSSLALQVEARNARRSAEQPTSGATAGRARARRGLQAGDVFVTTHSTLPDAHVVFHLLVDHSTLRSGDITSRHPAILGLRNVLKAACANDVTSLCLPLLLRHELTEEMTVSWCVRRAELVLKCVKGFMLEMAGWGGAELRTLTATVPRGAAPAVFAALAALLPAVFRISNPVYMRQAPDA